MTNNINGSATIRLRVRTHTHTHMGLQPTEYMYVHVHTHTRTHTHTRAQGRYFNSLPLEQVTVTVGGEECLINQTDNYLITCTTPDISSNITCAAEIRVSL